MPDGSTSSAGPGHQSSSEASAPEPMGAEIDLTESRRLWDRAVGLSPVGTHTKSKSPHAFAFGRYPIYAAHAQGCRVWDVDGHEYVDFVSALGPISLGYGHPAVNDAIRDQLDRGIISGLLWPLEVEVASALIDAIPGAELVRFFKGGGEATTAAARVARAATGRHLMLNAGYRGWQDTWASAVDPAVPPAVGEYVKEFIRGDLVSLERLLEENRGRVAAVITDVSYDGSNGREYLLQARQLAHQHGALFCLDEIVTGFRLARGGMQEYFDVEPDLACFAKAIANGMPLGVVAGRADIMRQTAGAQISLTFAGEALTLAACAATLRVYQTEDVIGHLWRAGQRLMDGLNGAAASHDVPFACVGYPPMTSMRFDAPADQMDGIWTTFLAECARHGVLFRRGGLNLTTAAHRPDDIDQAVRAADAAFTVLRRAGIRGSADESR